MSTPTLLIKADIVRILRGGRILRQFEIAKELNIAEHHNWSTHAALNHLVSNGTLLETRRHIVTKNGLSKLTYRHFSLSVDFRPTPMRKRDILRAWFGIA